jgi:hypothetical protein
MRSAMLSILAPLIADGVERALCPVVEFRSMVGRIGVAVFVCSAVIGGAGLAQPAPGGHIKLVRVSGRVIFPGGDPVSTYVRFAQIEPGGLRDEQSAGTDASGIFTFLVAPGKQYRVYLGGGYKTPPKTVDTAGGEDVSVGDMVFEQCGPSGFALPKAPKSVDLAGNLKLEQIVVEPQNLWNDLQPRPPAPVGPESNDIVELPPCWSGPSLDRRAEWEALPEVMFGRYLSVESFVGGSVKSIRVVRYDPRLTPSQIREEVRKAWLGVFWNPASSIRWAEGNPWNIEASVEYEDGKRGSILMDGWTHVAVQDRDGKYWYIRLWPAVD